jgi:hypothetical protein
MYRCCIPTLVLLFPFFAGAAQLHLEKANAPVRAGDTFVVELFLDTGADTLNALEGSLDLSPNLALQEFRFSGSLVPLWISGPQETKPGIVTFAGVIPGGLQIAAGTNSFTTQPGNIFTLVLKAGDVGTATITVGTDTAVYKDDGNGTSASLYAPALSFAILPSTGNPQQAVLPNDTTPPEPFTPLIASGTPYAYRGNVLLFSTQDKDSGISHFDVAASYRPDAGNTDLTWHRATSPYLIPQEDSGMFLFVRASDNAGNIRIEVVPPQTITLTALVHRWALFILCGALLLVILGAWFILRYRRHEGVILER